MPMPPETGTGPSPGRRRSVLSLAFLVAVFVGLWLLDFPKPKDDDLFMAGAAMNLAAGGGYSNPYLGWSEPGGIFSFQPPVYSYALAGWLKAFGVSAASMTAFQLFILAALALALWLLLWRQAAPSWTGWCAPLLALAAFLRFGLRPEALAAALSLAGVVLIAWRARPGFGMTALGCLLLFLGAATAPRMTLFVAGMLVVGLFWLWRGLPDRAARIRLLGAVAGALALAAVLFLWMIHFQPLEFWRAFHAHAQVVLALSGEQTWSRIVAHHLGPRQCVLLAVGGLLFLWGLRYRRHRLMQLAAALGVVFPVELSLGYLGNGAGVWHALLLILLLAAVLYPNCPPRLRWVPCLAVVALVVGLNLPFAVQVGGMLTGRIQPDRGDELARAVRLQPVPDRRLLVDAWVARYVFDYRLPAGSLDFWYAAPFPREGVAADFRPSDIYLVGPRGRFYLEQATGLPPQPRPELRVFRWSFDHYPCRVHIISGADCGGVRPGYVDPGINLFFASVARPGEFRRDF